MATYVLPTFNIQCDVFTAANFGVAARITVGVNLTPGRRVEQPISAAAGLAATSGAMYILLPKLTDIRDASNAGGADGVEIPPGSGRKYLVVFVDDIGKAFANEHRFAILVKTGVWPTPIT